MAQILSSTQAAVSVIMPVHNAGEYLAAAVDSILQQQDVTLELIVVDDHSIDDALIRLPSDEKLTIIPSPSRGIVSALNAGIKAARYKFIARMDADDIAAPNRLSTQLKFLLSHPQIDICGTKVRMFSDDRAIADGYLHYQNWINALCEHQDIEREFFIESPIPHPTAMMRTEALQMLGGYHDSQWPEDYDLWCRALLQGMKFAKPGDSDLLLWRDHEQRLSRNDKRYHSQQFLSCKAHYLTSYLIAQGITQCHIWGTGPTGLKLHDYLCEEGMLVIQFIDIAPKMEGRLKRKKPIQIVSIEEQQLPNIDPQNELGTRSIIIVAVAARGARAEIRNFLQARNLTEGREFIFAA